FKEKTSLKHIVEALGVPHPEVGRVLINGEESQLAAHVRDEDQIQIFPASTPFGDVSTSAPQFILDNHLGRLTTYLRLLGLDALYNPDWEDVFIADTAYRQNRILLTRDRGLLKRKTIQRGYCVRSSIPRDQTEEVIRQFNLTAHIKPFTRCPRCNGMLERIEKHAIIHLLQPLTRQFYDDFSRCIACGQIYWKGSHVERIKPFIERFVPAGPEDL
ncbi:MAG: Mut7-C RNAse domain-containing protein, partial [Chloroflexota bacterium]